MTQSEKWLAILLRLEGFLQLLALAAVFLPLDWMADIHRRLGLGEMPRTPVFEYLARSLSLFYALHGAITVYLSLDVRRYLSVVGFWAATFVLMGVIQLGVDLASHMPWWWTAGENGFVILLGCATLFLWRRAADESKQ